MTQELRPYQVQALDACRAAFASGHRRIVLVLPTGAGKTTVAAKAIESTLTGRMGAGPNTVLFQAHRTELIDQCSERLDENGLRAHGVIMAGHPRRRPHAPIQVASVQTLANRKPLDPPPRLIIADECHRVLGRQQLKIVSELYPGAFVLGLTATPWRLDGRGLGQFVDDSAQLFTTMVQGATYSELIAAGHILEPAVCCPWTPDLSDVGVGADGEFDADEVAELVDRPQTIKDIVDQWHQRANGARTVAFAASIEHSQHIVAAFREAGVTAEHLDGTTDKDERRNILRRVRSGETRVVSNYNVLGEGWDCPAVEVCILGRPTASLSLYMQCVGRVLRPSPGKSRALVLDFAGAVLRHGWPTADRDWSLRDRPRKRKGGGAADPDEAPPVAQCPKCLFARPSSKAQDPCANCGYVDPEVARKSPTIDGNSGVPLVEVTRDAVEAVVEPPKPPPLAGGRNLFFRPPAAANVVTSRPVASRPVQTRSAGG